MSDISLFIQVGSTGVLKESREYLIRKCKQTLNFYS